MQHIVRHSGEENLRQEPKSKVSKKSWFPGSASCSGCGLSCGLSGKLDMFEKVLKQEKNLVEKIRVNESYEL